MKKVGLTGGIGSGKTTVAKIFETIGTPIYYADIEAKKILNEDDFVIEQIITEFGNIYENKIIDRKKLAQIVFNNPQKLDKLNSIVHPAVLKHFEKWCVLKKDFQYIIEEAAILFESGSYKNMDKIITVFAPQEIRIDRVCLRDNTSRENVVARIKNQMNDKKKIELSHFVVNNFGNNMLISQVLTIHKKLLELL